MAIGHISCRRSSWLWPLGRIWGLVRRIPWRDISWSLAKDIAVRGIVFGPIILIAWMAKEGSVPGWLRALHGFLVDWFPFLLIGAAVVGFYFFRLVYGPQQKKSSKKRPRR